jgi:hypothetical protein
MKTISKIIIIAAVAFNALWLSSCEKEFYKDELYRKEISIVSGDNNIIGQEFEYGGDEGLLALYASGTTPLDEDCTIKLTLDTEAIGNYNQVNFDTQFDSYAMQLPDENYSVKNWEVVMKAGENTAFLPINVTIDDLLPWETYFIPIRIEKVSKYMTSLSKYYALLEIHRKNEFATTQRSTYYTMNGTTQSGWLMNNIFGSDVRRQSINSSKLVVPIGPNSIAIMPAAKVSSDARVIRQSSLKVTIAENEWINAPVYVEGILTDEVKPLRKVTIEPYLDGSDAIEVAMSPVEVSGYDPTTETIYLYYRYRMPSEGIWYDVRETMVRAEF